MYELTFFGHNLSEWWLRGKILRSNQGEEVASGLGRLIKDCTRSTTSKSIIPKKFSIPKRRQPTDHPENELADASQQKEVPTDVERR